MKVAHPPVRPEVGHGQVELSRRVGAVHQHENAGRALDLRRVVHREGHSGLHHPGAAARRCAIEDVTHRVVAVVGGEQLVALAQVQALQDGIHAGGGVGEEHQTVRVGADEGRRPLPGALQQVGQAAGQEVDRLSLHLLAPVLLGVEHLDGAGAEGSVVEEGHHRVE